MKPSFVQLSIHLECSSECQKEQKKVYFWPFHAGVGWRGYCVGNKHLALTRMHLFKQNEL